MAINSTGPICQRCGETAVAVSRQYENENVIWFYEHAGGATHRVKMLAYDSDLKMRAERGSPKVTPGKGYL
jgi:hypothetical protein